MSYFRLSFITLPLVLGAALMAGACAAPVVAGAGYAADGGVLVASDKTSTDHLISMVSKQDCAMWRVIKGRAVCKPREIGEVHVRGPNIMLGYWKRPEETAAVMLGDGWYKSGDVAWADEDGYLFVVDRAKDMIISGGENIYTSEVENAVFQHPDVLEVAVFGIPNKDFGEMVHAEVVIKPGTSVTSDEIVAVCRKHIGGYKVPRSVVVRSEPLPKSGAGKILKRNLRDPYWKGKERRVN